MFVNLKWNEINKNILRKAIINTARNRKTLEIIEKSLDYIELISDDIRLKTLWNNYQHNYDYAKDISFKDTIKAIKIINDVIVTVEV